MRFKKKKTQKVFSNWGVLVFCSNSHGLQELLSGKKSFSFSDSVFRGFSQSFSNRITERKKQELEW